MTTTDEASAAAVIASPPTFPVAWERPGDERLSWLTDRMHFPGPITPLDDWLIGCLWAGANRSGATYGFPLRYESRRINTYAYFAIVPDAGPPAELAARERAAYDRLQAAIGRLRLTWEGEFLPEIKGHLAAWEAFDPRGASPAALLDEPGGDAGAAGPAVGDRRPPLAADEHGDEPVRRPVRRALRRGAGGGELDAAPGLRQHVAAPEPGALGAEPPGAGPAGGPARAPGAQRRRRAGRARALGGRPRFPRRAARLPGRVRAARRHLGPERAVLDRRPDPGHQEPSGLPRPA